MNKYTVVVAGGNGSRMGSAIAKQYLEIGGKPILMHTLDVFYRLDPSIALILVIPANDFQFWAGLCRQYDFQTPHILVAGGKSRFQSVKNGLGAIEGEAGLVAIHDGVRPFVKDEVIRESFEQAAVRGSAVAVVPLRDSIRKLTGEGESCFQDRQYFRLVQTPQTFQLEKIKKAFEVNELEAFTDDATVYEHQGWPVHLIAGNPENIKITTPEDMDYADYLIRKSGRE